MLDSISNTSARHACRKAKAIELMLVDALITADPVLKMTERIHDPLEFVQMDDTILKQIEHYGMLHPGFESSEEYAPVSAAQKIISRCAQPHKPVSCLCVPVTTYCKHACDSVP